MPLEDALAAYDAGEIEDTLGHLRTHWRTHPHPRLAHLVVAVGAAAPPRPPLPDGRKRAAHADWLAIARLDDPADLPRLLAALPTGTSGQALERLTALGDDPRLVRWMLGLLERPPYTAETTRPLWRGLLARLEALAGPEDAAAIAALSVDYVSRVPTLVGTWLGNQLAKIASRLEDRAPAVIAETPALRALEAKVGEAPPPAASSGPNEADLVAAVYADPQAPGPRAVLQDFLLERGDPWGELLALQARGTPDPDGTVRPALSEREHELGETLRNRLLGGIAAAVEQVRFDRGFPDQVVLWRAKAALSKAVGHDVWRTVRSVRVSHWPGVDASIDGKTDRTLRDLVDHPAMVSLLEVVGISRQALTDLLERHARPWTSVAVQKVTGGDELSAWLPKLPGLRALSLPVADDDVGVLRALREHAPRLAHLQVSSVEPLGVWLAGVDALGVSRLLFAEEERAYGLRCLVTRGADGRLSALTVEALCPPDRPFPTDRVVELLDGLPDGALTRFTVAGAALPDPYSAPWRPPTLPDDAGRAALAAAVARFGL